MEEFKQEVQELISRKSNGNGGYKANLIKCPNCGREISIEMDNEEPPFTMCGNCGFNHNWER